MTHIICRLTAKNRDQPQNPTLSNRVWATFTFLYSAHTGNSIPDMTFTVGFRREGKFTDETLEWSFSIMRPEVSVQGAAVGAGVGALATLVGRRADMNQ